MATAKELLEKAIDAGAWVPDSVISDYKNMPGLTDELAAKAFGDKYAEMSWAEGADRIEDPTIPSMANVIGILGIEDDPKDAKGARTKEQKFIEDFPKNVAKWKKKITDNNVYGKRGWETVKEIWKQATRDSMQADIAKARKEAMDDAPLDFWLFQLPNIPGSSFVTRVVYPRATEHIENTGDFRAKDILADLGENLAMTVPGGAFTGIAGKGLAKVAPKAVKYFSGPGSNIFEGAVKGAGRMAGNLFGNAVVPFGAEAMDAAIYDDDDDDEGMEQRADFSAGDAAIGTAINQGVNRGLLRMAGPLIDSFSPGGIAEGGTEKFRKFLENLGRSFRQKGDDYASDVAMRVNTPVIAEAGEITPKGLSSVIHGGSDIVPDGQSRQALEQALGEQAVLKAIDRGELAFQPKIAQSAANRTKRINDVIEQENNLHELNTAMERGDHRDLTDKCMKTAIADAVSDKGTATPIRSMFKTKYKDGIHGGDIPLTADVVKKVIEENPAPIINYAAWHGKGSVGDTDRIWNEMKNTWKGNKKDVPAKRILNSLKQGWDSGYRDLSGNVLNQAIPAWGVNKIGSESDANLILSPLPNVKEALNESRQEVHEEPKKRKAASDILSIVSEDGSLTADDRKYLDAIAENPDIMKFGYKDDPNGFRLWLLERGNRLLQGTSAYRPTFPVE